MSVYKNMFSSKINNLFFLCLIFNSLSCTYGYYDNEINLECKGKKYSNVTLTAYYPDYSDQDHERAYLDAKGKNLQTLQDYLDNRTPFVTLAMDAKLNITYGTKVCIPELNLHFGHRILLEVRDAASDLAGSGFKRADICVRTEIDSYDVTVNKRVSLVFTEM